MHLHAIFAADLNMRWIWLLGCCWVVFVVIVSTVILLLQLFYWNAAVFFFLLLFSIVTLFFGFSYNYYVAIFLLFLFIFLLFTSFIGKFTSFDFVHIKFSSYVLDSISVSTKYLSIQTHIATIHFIRELVCLLSIWFNFKQFLNRKKLQWTKTPQFVTLYLLYLSIQYVCI